MTEERLQCIVDYVVHIIYDQIAEASTAGQYVVTCCMIR